MISIQKNYGDGRWHTWATPDSVAEAIEQVKGYCLGDGTSFRVVDHYGEIQFTWGPLGTIIDRRST